MGSGNRFTRKFRCRRNPHASVKEHTFKQLSGVSDGDGNTGQFRADGLDVVFKRETDNPPIALCIHNFRGEGSGTRGTS